MCLGDGGLEGNTGSVTSRAEFEMSSRLLHCPSMFAVRDDAVLDLKLEKEKEKRQGQRGVGESRGGRRGDERVE